MAPPLQTVDGVPIDFPLSALNAKDLPAFREWLAQERVRLGQGMPGPVSPPEVPGLILDGERTVMGAARDVEQALVGAVAAFADTGGDLVRGFPPVSQEDGPTPPSVPEDTEQRAEDVPSDESQTKKGLVSWKPLKEEFYYVPDNSAYPNPYILELYHDWGDGVGIVPDDAIRLQYINRVEVASPNAVERTRGMSGEVYAEHEGFVQKVFSISGRSGDSRLDLIRFQKMRNFLQKYAGESAKNKNALIRGKDVRLALHFPFEGEHHFCDVLTFDYIRASSSSTNSFEFRLTLVTNGLIGRKWALPEAKDALLKMASKYDLNHLNESHPCLVLAERENARLPPWIDRTPFEPLRKILAKAGEDLDDPCEMAWLARLGLTNIGAYIASLQASLREQALSATLYARLFLADMADASLITLGARYVECAVESVALPVFRASMVAPTPLREQQRVGIHVVRAGRNNAYDIAEDTLGSRDRAPAIMRANQMNDAYTTVTGAPLAAGDSVLVPTATGPYTVEGDVFGVDLRLEDGDLVAVGEDDIAVIRGYDAFKQNITHRLMTVRGENKTFPSYGLPRYVGHSETSDVPGDLLSNIRTQLMADHRTERITSLELEELGDKVTVNMVVQPIGHTSARVEYSYDLVT